MNDELVVHSYVLWLVSLVLKDTRWNSIKSPTNTQYQISNLFFKKELYEKTLTYLLDTKNKKKSAKKIKLKLLNLKLEIYASPKPRDKIAFMDFLQREPSTDKFSLNQTLLKP